METIRIVNRPSSQGLELSAEDGSAAVVPGRAVGVIDVQIAATAAEYGATVLHYDAGFDHISRAYPQARAQRVVARGSLD